MPNPFTYRALLKFLQELTEEQLDMNVSIYDQQSDEYYPAKDVDITVESDVLDEGHPVIVIPYVDAEAVKC